jgi:hypothetical protein
LFWFRSIWRFAAFEAGLVRMVKARPAGSGCFRHAYPAQTQPACAARQGFVGCSVLSGLEQSTASRLERSQIPLVTITLARRQVPTSTASAVLAGGTGGVNRPWAVHPPCLARSNSRSIFKPSGIAWRLGKCDQTPGTFSSQAVSLGVSENATKLPEHFQAKRYRLASRKMRSNSRSIFKPSDIAWRLGKCDQKHAIRL